MMKGIFFLDVVYTIPIHGMDMWGHSVLFVGHISCCDLKCWKKCGMSYIKI